MSDHIENTQFSTQYNLVDQSKLNSVMEKATSGSRKIGTLQLELPTPAGVAKFSLSDYESESAKHTLDLSEPETIVVSAATNELDLKKASNEASTVKDVLGLAFTAITQLAAADAEAANRRHQQELELLKLRHEMEIQTMKLRDELEAARHQRIQESKRT